MKLIEKIPQSTDEAEEFVLECEREVSAGLEALTEDALSKNNRLITLSGPTCSGKTTAAGKLSDAIDKRGYRATVISLDDFFKDGLRGMENVNYESADAIDLECFHDCVCGLFSGSAVKLPKYDFKSGRRSGYVEYLPRKNDIFIFEGIQATYPELTAAFGDLPHTSVFISVAEDCSVTDTVFSKSEIRLARRIVRDARVRNTGVAETLSLWKNVRLNEECNIFPAAKGADVTVNSLLGYEVMFIGGLLLPLIDRETELKKDLSELSDLYGRLEKVRCPLITEEMIPRDSLFREFIG